MSLKLTNKATAKQIALLQKLEYIGTGKYAPEQLTLEQAAELIDQLFIERGKTYGEIQQMAGDYYDLPTHDWNQFKEDE